jgi:putative NADPH-quinone reductase
MRILVIYAHPVATSFVAACKDALLTALDGRHEVKLLDLYAIGFDPVLNRVERLAYHDESANGQGLEEHLALLRWAEGLIFVYPTWWYGLPAILKGWLDRAWLPGVTFTMPAGNRPVGPLLTQIRLLGGISTYGAPWWFTRWVGDPGRRTLMRGIKALCAPRCRTFWLALHRMDSSTDADRAAFLGKIAGTAAAL